MAGILSAGIAPGIALLCYFYLKDKYEPEPWSLVFRTFIFGAILVLPISFIQYVLEIENIMRSPFFSAFLSSGLLEELSKWLVLFYTAYLHAEFDEPYDGIVYGTAVSLGFATAENIMYLMIYGLDSTLSRSLLPVSSHALFGVIMGYYIGKAKFTTVRKQSWILLSILLPFILHGIYNYIIFTQESWLPMIVPFMLFLWWFGLKKVRTAQTLSKRHFEKQYNLANEA